MKGWRGAWVVLLLLTACGDDAPVDAAIDTGVDAVADASEVRGVEAPMIPWFDEGLSPVELTPCPPGWRVVADREPPECDPYPVGGPTSCALGEAHFVGETGCRPIGSSCPAGEFSTSLPTEGPILYVQSDAPTGGDGSPGAPYAALVEVPWASLDVGTTVALGKGRYPGVVPLKAGVRVEGACPAETLLTGIAAPVRAVISVTSAGAAAVVANLSVRDAPQGGAYVTSGRSLVLEGVLFDSVDSVGLEANGAGTRVTLRDVVIHGTRRTEFGGFGIKVDDGASVEGARVLITGSVQNGVLVDSGGSLVSLTDASISDSTGLADGRRGRGVAVQNRARFEASRTLIANNHESGLIVGFADSEAVLEDVIIRDTQSVGIDGTNGRGLSAQDGAHITATRLVVAASAETGIFVASVGSLVTLRHVVVRDTSGQASDGAAGRGISVSEGGALDAGNLAVLRNRELGLFVIHEGSRATVHDSVIADTQVELSTSTGGRGASAQGEGLLDLSRVLITDSRDAGVFTMGEGSEVRLADVVILDTVGIDETQSDGVALAAQVSAHIEGSRVRIVNARGHGLLNIAATVKLVDVGISGVTPSPCSTPSCPHRPFGYGASTLSGTTELTQFLIDDVTLCGVLLARDRSWAEDLAVDLASGTVSGECQGSCRAS